MPKKFYCKIIFGQSLFITAAVAVELFIFMIVLRFILIFMWNKCNEKISSFSYKSSK